MLGASFGSDALEKTPYSAKSSLQYCLILCRTHHTLSPL